MSLYNNTAYSKTPEEESGTLLRARLWLAPDFPLNAAHFALLLELFAVASKRARRARAALLRWQLRDAFPVKLYLPLLLTVWAQITCTHFEPLSDGGASLPAGYFDVPLGFEIKDASLDSVATELGADAVKF